MRAILSFDIETIPDIAALRRIYQFAPEVGDAEAAEMAARVHRQKIDRATDFLPPHLHRAIVISCALRRADKIKVFSLAEPEYDEAGAVRMFFKIIGKYAPQLVSWNGGGFDLPLLHYRAMALGISAPLYWETGETRDDFRFNNYHYRYGGRHTDLMDALSRYQRPAPPLDEFARLCGLPGKMGIDGAQVWPLYQAGKIEEIKHYCESDALNAYLLYQRFRYFRGQIGGEELAAENRLAREYLNADADKWAQFLAEWEEDGENDANGEDQSAEKPPLDAEA